MRKSLLGLMLLGCTGGDPDVVEREPHPADDSVSLAHAQVVGTHNSYHVQTTDLGAWAYTHAPLDVQVADQGVRQFELDLYWDGTAWVVYHLPVLDEGTTCLRLSDCLRDLQAGSDELFGQNLPIVVLLEPKQDHDPADAEAQLLALDADLASLGERRILPDEVEGAWPVLAGQRGRFVFVWHDRGAWRDTAVAVQPESLFFDGYGDVDAERAAVHSINDPTDPQIAGVVAAGHLVRTRADVDGVEAAADDTTRREVAMASGAHFISTDFPVAHPDSGYVVEMGPQSAARCNPVTAPNSCGALQLEDPALLD